MIKAALIGCGRIGYSFEKDKISGDSLSHFHELNKNEDIQLEAVVDSEFSTIQHISNKYKIRTYSNHQELISNHNLDLIVIATPDEKDKIFEFGEVKICVDMKSYLFLNGMEIDYEEDLFKSGLVFNTPQAQRTCGCGESVAF